MYMKRIYIFLLSVGLCLAVRAQQQGTHMADVARNLQVFDEIYRQLDAYYVDTLSADTTMQWAIEGMLRRVDPFTSYYREDDDELLQLSTGQYAGIGSVIRYNKKLRRVVVSQPYSGTPSREAGVRAGDILLTIDGQDVEGKGTPEVSKMLRGDAGTRVTLEVRRPGQEGKPLTFVITRRNIRLPVIPYYGMQNDSIGYVLLNQFTAGCASRVRHAVNNLRQQGMKRLVLDLRDNPGGVIEEAVSIVNLFVPQGRKVVYTKGKVPSSNHEFYTTSEPLDTLTPMIVLVNSGSASASEIVSGSLQDMDRAVVVGQRTYGKGLVQSVRELPFNRNLKLTISRYYIPSGRCIQAYDYRHLNPDGSVGTVPDSLTRVFYTRGGRPVRDGGGINPDVVARPDTMASFVYDVAASDELFDWAVQYVRTHPAPVAGERFRLSDADYEDFARYMQESGFTANRRTEEVLNVLKSAARLEGYYNDYRAEFDALEACLKSDTRSGVLRMKQQIMPILEAEIVGQALDEGEVVRQTLAGDVVYHKALELLAKPEEMEKILNPKHISDL